MSTEHLTTQNQTAPPEILVVDDNPSNLNLLNNILKKAGYAVRAELGAELALQAALTRVPALILLDLRMPGMDGFELCRHLKQDIRTRNIPIIFVSGDSDTADRVRGFALGAADFVSKPFQREEILARVHTHLALHEARESVEQRVRERTAELETSMRRLSEMEKAMELFNIGIKRVDANTGRLLQVNDSFCQLHGYTRDELLGMTMADLDPALPALPFAEISRSYVQQGRGRFESVHRHKEGHAIPVAVTYYSSPANGDYPANLICFISDISASKLAEQKLREERDRARLYFDVAEVFIVVFDYQGCIERINRKGCETLGWEERDLIGKHWSDYCMESDRDTLKQFYDDLMAGKSDAHYRSEYNIVSREGHIRTLKWSRVVLRNEQGKPTGTVTSGRDVTEERRAQRNLELQQFQLEKIVQERTSNLRASEAQTRAILTTMLDSVVHIDSLGKILSVNVAVQDLFGYTEAEMVGHNVSMLMPESVAIKHDGYLARYLTTREKYVVDQRRAVDGRHKDGSTIPIELAVNEMADDYGSTFIGVIHDLRPQKKSEQLVQNALLAAQAAAEAKSTFLANMSHEIRTPLNAVLGLAQIGMRDSTDAQSVATFNRLHDAGKHLLDVVNDILDFSKIEAGKLSIETRSFSLFGVIDNVRSFVVARAEEKGLALTVSIAPSLAEWVEGDALRLSQILTNLLSNAIKFTAHGEVLLRLTRDGDKMNFMVLDSGIGISEAQQKRLFRPFEQADASTTRNYGGTGLGLVISSELAHLMGGDITVDSSPGAGSSFCLQLPLPLVAAPVRPGKNAHPAAVTGPRLGGVAVLAADDVEINRHILEDFLRHEGAQVVFANNGMQVLERLEEYGANAFDVVLMDLQMPVMDGYEATRRVCAIAPGLPVIGLTAHAMAEVRDKCLAAGMLDHVSKPIDSDALVMAIRRLLPVAVPAEAVATEPGTEQQARQFPECANADIIDLNMLVNSVGSDPAKISKYVKLYLETTHVTLNEIKAALAERNPAALSGLGHRLKPGSIFMGAIRFAELCKQLELQKNTQDLEQAGVIVGQMQALFEQISHSVNEVIK